ncbi:hypothetical protein AC578_5515 [Pseudocercospora eumusae]|uniref:Uncharacterized protein n=1 Tax=Pseudocercospora eumusae TaxID=321146 RepID=A0A139H7W5_9PEZI|nr:hypothetical protein AC578_5515 [Pseudocercospora eumusae]
MLISKSSSRVISLCFSFSLPKIDGTARLLRAMRSFLPRLKCSAARRYSFDTVLPKTPTSSSDSIWPRVPLTKMVVRESPSIG